MIARSTATNIDEYIADFPPDVQVILEKIRQTIRQAAPEAQETINYAIPTFTLKGNLVHFAAFEKHIGFYPTPSGIEHFKSELSGYDMAKGSVQFPLNRPIPYELISEIVRFRVQENLLKAEAKSRSKSLNALCAWFAQSVRFIAKTYSSSPSGQISQRIKRRMTIFSPS